MTASSLLPWQPTSNTRWRSWLNQMPDIAEEYRSEFCTALDLTVECFAVFHKALEAYFAPKDKLQKIRNRNKAVGELESRIDQIEPAASTGHRL